MKRPPERIMLYTLLAILSVNGLTGGMLMIIQTDGSLLGMEEGFLNGSPFSNYLIPGLLLMLFNGLLPACALIGMLTGRRNRIADRLNIFPEKHWGWTFSVYSGITTLIWIIVQQLITSFFVLQPIISTFGVLILIVSLLPRIQRFYTIKQS